MLLRLLAPCGDRLVLQIGQCVISDSNSLEKKDERCASLYLHGLNPAVCELQSPIKGSAFFFYIIINVIIANFTEISDGILRLYFQPVESHQSLYLYNIIYYCIET